MSDAKAITAKFASSVFPTAEDRALWESLSPSERLAVVTRDEDAGARSGVARNASLHEILADLRAPTGK
jgi:hypothetical protein